MLRRLKIIGFKSIAEAEVQLPRLTVLFGPNAAGKSNLLDAIQALSRLGTERTVSEALSEPIRGHPIEAFAFPSGGLRSLLNQQQARLALEADLEVGRDRLRYRVEVAMQPASGGLSVVDEYLATFTARWEPTITPRIEKVETQLRIRRKSKPAHPRQEPLGLNHTILSDPRLGGIEYRQIERCRNELTGWRVYYLDPRVAMRSAKPPAEVSDLGLLGEDVAPFLFRLKGERKQAFDAVTRALRSLIPSVENLQVDLDKQRGTLDIMVRQGGTDFSSRIISEGTLRVLALCCIAANPWAGSLIAFEEPENGVHPRRLELIAQLLTSLAIYQKRQVIVTTHSPLFCDAVLKAAESHVSDVGLFNVRQTKGETEFRLFQDIGPLFRDRQVSEGLAEASEDGRFEAIVMRGILDE